MYQLGINTVLIHCIDAFRKSAILYIQERAKYACTSQICRKHLQYAFWIIYLLWSATTHQISHIFALLCWDIQKKSWNPHFIMVFWKKSRRSANMQKKFHSAFFLSGSVFPWLYYIIFGIQIVWFKYWCFIPVTYHPSWVGNLQCRAFKRFICIPSFFLGYHQLWFFIGLCVFYCPLRTAILFCLDKVIIRNR